LMESLKLSMLEKRVRKILKTSRSKVYTATARSFCPG